MCVKKCNNERVFSKLLLRLVVQDFIELSDCLFSFAKNANILSCIQGHTLKNWLGGGGGCRSDLEFLLIRASTNVLFFKLVKHNLDLIYVVRA